MKKTKELSVTNQIRIRYAMHGVAWMVAGIFKFFDNIPCRIISGVALLISIFLLIKFMFADREMEDEMAELNLYKAKAITLDLIKIIVCMLIISLTMINLIFDINLFSASIKSIIVPILFIVMGIENFLIGVIFNHFDKE